jgi:hypothetical protein
MRIFYAFSPVFLQAKALLLCMCRRITLILLHSSQNRGSVHTYTFTLSIIMAAQQSNTGDASMFGMPNPFYTEHPFATQPMPPKVQFYGEDYMKNQLPLMAPIQPPMMTPSQLAAFMGQPPLPPIAPPLLQRSEGHPDIDQGVQHPLPIFAQPTQYWFALGNMRYVVVKVHNKQLMINVRQFTATGCDLHQTRNGINLYEPEWNELVKQFDQLKTAVDDVRRYTMK